MSNPTGPYTSPTTGISSWNELVKTLAPIQPPPFLEEWLALLSGDVALEPSSNNRPIQQPHWFSQAPQSGLKLQIAQQLQYGQQAPYVQQL
jgi:hypothetical protein